MVVLAVIFVAFGCSKEPQYIETVTPFDNPYIVQTDTFGLHFDVERLDSFQTSGYNQIILGYNNDTAFGTISSASYFRLTMPTVTAGTIGTLNQAYDSLILILHPNQMHYGDTNSVININVHRVNADITKAVQNNNESIVFYNKDKFSVDNSLLGTITQTIRPNTSDSIRIKLDDQLGKTLYNFYKTSATELANNDNFQTWFKGIRLSTDSTLTNVIYGFSTATAVMRFYYHEDVGVKEVRYIDFTISGAPYQFNSIYGNTQPSTFLKNLTPGKTINSAALNHSFYINSLMGIRTKITMPSVKNALTIGDFVKVVSAEMRLKPLMYSYDFNAYTLFPNLYLFYENADLSFSGPMAAATGSGPENGSLIIDKQTLANTGYFYNVSSYVFQELNANIYTTRKLMPWEGYTPSDLSFKRMIGADNTLNQHKQRSSLTMQLLIFKQQ